MDDEYMAIVKTTRRRARSWSAALDGYRSRCRLIL